MIARFALALAAAALVAAAPVQTDFRMPVGVGYQPADKDERGLWMQVEEMERQVKTSAFTIHDAALEGYVREVFCRAVGAEHCAGVRIYLVRTPEFNASMAPTGMMIVNSGLLLRLRNEAQLAAILGHEYTHYANRHSLQGFRDRKSKVTAMAWLSMVPVGGYAAAAAMTAVQMGLVSSVFRFSRTMEAEADAGSIPLMAQGGYDPGQAWRVWDQMRAEMDATAAARGKRSRKDDDRGLLASHPPTADRLAALKLMAETVPADAARSDGRAAYRAAVAPWWPRLVDDQIKLNDFGATDFLLGTLAEDGWTADLLYARGELYRTRGKPDDLVAAAGFYTQAIALPGAVAECWRGLGLVQVRGGDEVAGRAALVRYLEKKPEAPDRSMIAMIAGEGN